MKIEYSNTEFKPGTKLRRMYFYDDDGDVIMTNEIVYEAEEEQDDSDGHYDGPEDDE
jgi:hypothetical protein